MMVQKERIQPIITLFLSTSMTLPIVQMLRERYLLAGVVVTPRVDADSVQLEQQLLQMQVPAVRYNDQDIAQTVLKIKEFGGNLGLIATFAVLLPAAALSCFEYGIYNVHGSLLPKYQGANPVFWQVKNDEQKGAVVIHKVEEGMDTGAIAVSYKFDIHPLDTFGTLNGTLFQIMPVVIDEFLTLFNQHHGNIPLEKQQGQNSKAPHPGRSELCVDWNRMGAHEISALARACNPHLGGAQVSWKGASLGIMQASPVEMPTFGVASGAIVHIGAPEGLIVATKEKALRIETVYMRDGVFTGLSFAERFSLNAGEAFANTA